MKNSQKAEKTTKAENLSVSPPEKMEKDELSDGDLRNVSGRLTSDKVEASGENIRRVK